MLGIKEWLGFCPKSLSQLVVDKKKKATFNSFRPHCKASVCAHQLSIILSNPYKYQHNETK